MIRQEERNKESIIVVPIMLRRNFKNYLRKQCGTINQIGKIILEMINFQI